MHIFFFKQIQDLSLCHYQGYTDQSLDLYELEITVTLSTFRNPTQFVGEYLFLIF